jgi:hypothetical protein
VLKLPVVPYSRSVQQQSLPSFRVQSTANEDTFGAGLGRTVSAIGDEAFKIAKQEEVKSDIQAVQTALTNSMKDINDFHYNVDTGVLHAQGVNAKGITANADKSTNDIITSYADGLTDNQKQAYMRTITPQIQAFRNATQNHEYKQNNVALQQSADALATQNSDIAATAYNNPDISDNAIRVGMQSIVTKGISLGLPNEVISQNVKKYNEGTIAKMVQTALNVNDINGATATLQRYGDKLEGNSFAELNSAISKKALPIKSNAITDGLFAQFGMNEEAGMNQLRKKYESDPNFKSYSATYQARMEDERRFKSAREKASQETTLSRLWKSGTVDNAINIINEGVANGTIKPGQEIYLLNQAKGAINSLSPGSKATPEAKHWASYELNGGLERHLLKVREYYTLLGQGKEFTPQEQTSYDYAASQVTAYKVFKSNGGFDPAEEDQKANEAQSNEQGIWRSINDLASKGLSKDEIINRINALAPKYGFEPSYFIDNADWSSQGNKGGAK